MLTYGDIMIGQVQRYAGTGGRCIWTTIWQCVLYFQQTRQLVVLHRLHNVWCQSACIHVSPWWYYGIHAHVTPHRPVDCHTGIGRHSTWLTREHWLWSDGHHTPVQHEYGSMCDPDEARMVVDDTTINPHNRHMSFFIPFCPRSRNMHLCLHPPHVFPILGL